MAYIHQGPDLALNKDKSKVVPADSEEAAFVLVVDGGSLPDDEAARWGLLDKQAKASQPETGLVITEEPAEKAKASPTDDKARKGSRQNKGA